MRFVYFVVFAAFVSLLALTIKDWQKTPEPIPEIPPVTGELAEFSAWAPKFIRVNSSLDGSAFNGKTFVERLYDDKWETYLVAGIEAVDQNAGGTIYVYLVDGKNWHLAFTVLGSMKGCGQETKVNSAFHDVDELRKSLKKIESPDIRFVAIGSKQPVLHEVRVYYVNKKTGQDEK